MSTQNIRLYGETDKILSELSPNTLIKSSGRVTNTKPRALKVLKSFFCVYCLPPSFVYTVCLLVFIITVYQLFLSFFYCLSLSDCVYSLFPVVCLLQSAN